MSSYYHACTDCGCLGVERDFNRCGSCAGKSQVPQPAVLIPTAPVEATQATEEPTAQDWQDYYAWCQEQDLRDRDMMDAHRELEYQDILDAQL